MKYFNAKRNIAALIIILLSMLMFVSSVSAIGIMPARNFVEVEDQDEYSGSFWIVNNDQLDLDLKVYAEGNLENIIDI